jgi:uncharacterized protein YcfL
MRSWIVILLILSSILVVGCSADAKETVAVDGVDGVVADNPLAGTCLQGKSCTQPTCGKWVDANNDNHCDRGI